MSDGHSVEGLLAQIDREATSETVNFELCVPTQLTLRGARVGLNVGMAVVLDRLQLRDSFPTDLLRPRTVVYIVTSDRDQQRQNRLALLSHFPARSFCLALG